jgi:hypothetical protein
MSSSWCADPPSDPYFRIQIRIFRIQIFQIFRIQIRIFPDFIGLRSKICEDSPEAGGGGLNEFGGPIIAVEAAEGGWVGLMLRLCSWACRFCGYA